MSEIIDVIHKTIYQFFDVCGDYEEVTMSDKNELLLEVNKAICNNLNTLQQEPKWIPVSERLPKPQEFGDEDLSEHVLIALHIQKDNDVVGRAYYCFSEKKWYTDRLGIGKVTAWMPLPEPYSPNEEEEENEKMGTSQ